MEGIPKTSFRPPHSSPMPPEYLSVFASSSREAHVNEEPSEDIFSQFTEIDSPVLFGSTDEAVAGPVWTDSGHWPMPEDPYAWMVTTYPVPQTLPEPEDGSPPEAVSRSSSASTESSETEGELTALASPAVPGRAIVGPRDRVAERRERRRTQNRRAQAAFRERRETLVQSLQAEIDSITTDCKQARAEKQRLETHVYELKQQNELLKKYVHLAS
ncbi:uncharacterized protein AB675_5967 [Cyphellophora attinorum]|uniref:BZIP domain-containing protein n=1 Tax=Cyphellophora attinorum TaxID=1664694 RepID=A0A0N0NJR3_9EURO|nr:uncharacterized protein AB675_5967 [Phialophora attinorum]KPI36949.1 hypothetical protein AB675_5967 [Phialophora attinorum]